jgi:ATP-dependent Lon protease
VIIPEGNRKDTIDIPSEIKKKLKFRFFGDVMMAIKFALDKKDGESVGSKRKSARCSA